MKVLYTSRTLSGGSKFGHIVEVPDGVTPIQACVEHRLSFLGREPTPPSMLFRTYDGMLNTTCEAYVRPSVVNGNRHVSIAIVDPAIEDTVQVIHSKLPNGVVMKSCYFDSVVVAKQWAQNYHNKYGASHE